MRTSPIISLACSALVAATAAFSGENGNINREIGRTTEKELKVTLSSAFGTVLIGRGESGKILIAEGTANVMDNTAIAILIEEGGSAEVTPAAKPEAAAPAPAAPVARLGAWRTP